MNLKSIGPDISVDKLFCAIVSSASKFYGVQAKKIENPKFKKNYFGLFFIYELE